MNSYSLAVFFNTPHCLFTMFTVLQNQKHQFETLRAVCDISKQEKDDS